MQNVTQANTSKFTTSVPPKAVTLDDLNAKLEQVLGLVVEVNDKMDALDARLSELSLDYGNGFTIEG